MLQRKGISHSFDSKHAKLLQSLFGMFGMFGTDQAIQR
jgi:hypothetical protein